MQLGAPEIISMIQSEKPIKIFINARGPGAAFYMKLKKTHTIVAFP